MENQAGYEQPAAIIDPPRSVLAMGENGLIEYEVWGWVKMSAKFAAHIKRLKGAKLAVWQVIALNINKDGECGLSVGEIADGAGYSLSETGETIKELDGMGYLSVTRMAGRRSVYRPEFVARAGNSPTEETRPPQKNDPSRKTTPPVVPLANLSDPSSQSIAGAHPSINRVKRVNGFKNSKPSIPGIEAAMFADRPVTAEDFPQAAEDEALKAFESAFRCPGSWKWHPGKGSDETAWKSLREAVVRIYKSDGAAGFEGYVTWSAQPYSRGAMTLLAIKNNPENFALSWVAYQGSDAYRAKKTDEDRGVYLDEYGIPLT